MLRKSVDLEIVKDYGEDGEQSRLTSVRIPKARTMQQMTAVSIPDWALVREAWGNSRPIEAIQGR